MQLLSSLRVLLTLPPPTSHPHLLTTHNQIANGIGELVHSQANNIKLPHDWSILFSMLECVGTGRMQTPNITGVTMETERNLDVEEGEVPDSTVDNESDQSNSRSHPSVALSDSTIKEYVWISGEERAQKPVISSLNQFDLLVEESIRPHTPRIFFKCCETLSYVVRSDLHVTASNFGCCVHCIRIFSETCSSHQALEQETSPRRCGREREGGRERVREREGESVKERDKGRERERE